jgi:hypothetical protein
VPDDDDPPVDELPGPEDDPPPRVCSGDPPRTLSGPLLNDDPLEP